MYTTFFLSSLLTAALALPSPLMPIEVEDGDWTPATTTSLENWKPATNSAVQCQTNNRILPEYKQIVYSACKAMMGKCAYSDSLITRADEFFVCTETIDRSLKEEVTTTQPWVGQDGKPDTANAWAVKFSVTPKGQGTTWRKEDCEGYFAQLLTEQQPIGCQESKGSGAGTLKVGDTQEGNVSGTVFKVEMVDATPSY